MKNIRWPFIIFCLYCFIVLMVKCQELKFPTFSLEAEEEDTDEDSYDEENTTDKKTQGSTTVASNITKISDISNRTQDQALIQALVMAAIANANMHAELKRREEEHKDAQVSEETTTEKQQVGTTEESQERSTRAKEQPKDQELTAEQKEQQQQILQIQQLQQQILLQQLQQQQKLQAQQKQEEAQKQQQLLQQSATPAPTPNYVENNFAQVDKILDSVRDGNVAAIVENSLRFRPPPGIEAVFQNILKTFNGWTGGFFDFGRPQNLNPPSQRQSVSCVAPEGNLVARATGTSAPYIVKKATPRPPSPAAMAGSSINIRAVQTKAATPV